MRGRVMAQRDERWYAGRWQRVSEHNERVWQKAETKLVELEWLAGEEGWSAKKLDASLLQYRQVLLGWRDQ
jgi:hypothetical protein